MGNRISVRGRGIHHDARFEHRNMAHGALLMSEQGSTARPSDDGPTIEDVGLDRIIDERFILHELVGMLLAGDKSILDDRSWLEITYERTEGRISYVTEGSREVLPIGETRAAYIAAWNDKCRELAKETARAAAIKAESEQRHTPEWIQREFRDARKQNDEVPTWLGGTGKALSDAYEQVRVLRAVLADALGELETIDSNMRDGRETYVSGSVLNRVHAALGVESEVNERPHEEEKKE